MHKKAIFKLISTGNLLLLILEKKLFRAGRAEWGDNMEKEKISWVEYKKEEIEEIVKKLYNEGKSKSEIGLILRDQYGIPKASTVTGKTISQILKEKKIKEDMPEDLMNLIKKSVNLMEHMNKTKKDQKAKKGYEFTVSKIRRLIKYYKRKGVLPKDWKYTPENAKLLVK